MHRARVLARYALVVAVIACQAYTLIKAVYSSPLDASNTGVTDSPRTGQLAEHIITFAGLVFNVTIMLLLAIGVVSSALSGALAIIRRQPLLACGLVGFYLTKYVDFFPPAMIQYRDQFFHGLRRIGAGAGRLVLATERWLRMK